MNIEHFETVRREIAKAFNDYIGIDDYFDSTDFRLDEDELLEVADNIDILEELHRSGVISIKWAWTIYAPSSYGFVDIGGPYEDRDEAEKALVQEIKERYGQPDEPGEYDNLDEFLDTYDDDRLEGVVPQVKRLKK